MYKEQDKTGENIMKMSNKIIMSMLALLAPMLIFSGCGKGEESEKTNLYIDKDGSVTENIVESWDKDYYDENEFKKEIDKEIAVYESSHSKSNISLEKFELEGKKANVNLEYDSVETFKNFNNIKAFLGTIKDAQKEGFLFEGEFVSTANKPSITFEELKGSEEYCAFIFSDKTDVYTEFKILYASSNIKVSEDCKKAVVSEDGSEFSYLIYKK